MPSAPTIGGVFLGQATPLDFNMPDNQANAFLVREAANDYISADTSNNAEALRFGESGVIGLSYNFNLKDNTTTALRIAQDGDDYIVISTLDPNQEAITFGEAGTKLLNFVFHLKDNAVPFTLVNSASTVNLYKLTTANGAEAHDWNGDGPGAQYSFELADNRSSAFVLAQGANEYYRARTTNGGERQDWSNCELVLNLKDNIASAIRMTEAFGTYFEIKTSNGTEGIKIGAAGATLGFFGSFGTTIQTITGNVTTGTLGDLQGVVNDLLQALGGMTLLVDSTT